MDEREEGLPPARQVEMARALCMNPRSSPVRARTHSSAGSCLLVSSTLRILS
jgi:hypothetical protein